jgi:hypothetical protein
MSTNRCNFPKMIILPKPEAGHCKTLSVLQAVEYEDLRSPYRVFARVLDRQPVPGRFLRVWRVEKTPHPPTHGFAVPSA